MTQMTEIHMMLVSNHTFIGLSDYFFGRQKFGQKLEREKTSPKTHPCKNYTLKKK